MRLPTRAGVLASRGNAAQFVNSNINTGGAASQAISIPSGAQAGDIAIIICWAGFSDSATISGGAGGWTRNTVIWTSYSYYSSIFYKVLASGDLAGVTVNSGGSNPIACLVYRGASAVGVKSTNPGQVTDLDLAGFTKNASCKAVVSLVQDRDGTVGFSPPGTFVSRSGGAAGFFAIGTADIINPSNYVNGTTVTWTGFATGADQIGWLLELT